MQHIICAGYKYTDIDVLASSVALRELMHLQGKNVAVHLTGPFNATVPSACKYWDTGDVIRTAPLTNKEMNFIIVDISNPYYIEKFVEIEKVSAVYDHHHGFEELWKKLLGEKAKIEPIGACATLIWEEFKREKLNHRISSPIANFLYTAIISNTLNFKAQISSIRDEKAAIELSDFTTLSENWIKEYYKEMEISLLRDLPRSIQNDTKGLILQDKKFFFSQIEIWNAKELLQQYNLLKVMSRLFPEAQWMLSVVNIERGYNHIFTNSEVLENDIQKVIPSIKESDFLKTEKLWLRKEIVKLLNPMTTI